MLRVAVSRYGVENISAVRTKSITSTPSEAMTTVRVVAVRDALGRRLRLVALVERDEGADEAEHDALDDAVADVAPDVDAATA